MSGKVSFSKAIGAGVAVAGAVLGTGMLVFNEVMNRRAKLPAKMIQANDDAAEKKNDSPMDERMEWFKNQSFEEYTIENSRGQNLRGYLLRADEPSDVFVFCSHGYRSTGKREFNCMAKFHHDCGYNVFLVDHQASGESDGNYIGFGYYEYKDSLEWLDFLKKTFGENIQIILHGVSMGSATVMLMCGDESLPENVKFAVADCGYTSVRAEFEYVLKNAHVPTFPLIRSAELFNKKIGGYGFDDVDTIGSVSRAKIPMLFIHGKTDTFVPTEMASELYNACNSEYKDLLLVDDAWHAESYRKNPDGYEAKVKEFEDKFIDKKYTAAVSA